MKAILKNLGNEIRGPQSVAEIARLERGFYEKFDFIMIITLRFMHLTPSRHHLRHCYGAMDGTDIAIRVPVQGLAQAFYNKDRFHSIKLHIVCDSEFGI